VSSLDGDVEPLSWLSPSDVELIFRRLNQIIRTVIDLFVKLGIGNVDALIHAELIQIGSIRGIESTTAVVFGSGIVIRHSFSAAIVIGALHPPGNLLRSEMVAAVLKGNSLVAV
jgi:hypothetical protein